MVQYIPPPDPRSLLPPLLACLPTAFVSSRPPPDFLPLLSPILRQRLQLLAGDAPTASGSWLPLLCWDPRQGAQLPDVIEGIQLEPHPVSGEIELGDIKPAKYRRTDTETLHAQLILDDYGLSAVYLWCMGDESAGGHAWRLAELRILNEQDVAVQWTDSIAEANENFRNQNFVEALQDWVPRQSNGNYNGIAHQPSNQEDNDDDDDYWNSYDRTPGRTPLKRSPAPTAPNASITDRKRSTSELDYYARYETEVQPALDAHDPSEAASEQHESTLNGNVLSIGQEDYKPQLQSVLPNGNSTADTPTSPYRTRSTSNQTDDNVSQPRPISPPSPGHVARLEESASSHSQAEVGIRQHISSETKNLFRLARSAGIDRAEFTQIMNREIESLAMLDMDE
ncbi:MAG: hypothetical protein M1820_009001 [Bogoriella megaspora]|nr:MAG: hypothetical protein M1820_009001 [Bogoriella megaspora]